jgi:hypothetical protein
MFLFYFIDSAAVDCNIVLAFVGNPTEEVRERLSRLHGKHSLHSYNNTIEDDMTWLLDGFGTLARRERLDHTLARIALIEQRTGLVHTHVSSFKPLNFAPNVTSSVFVSVFVWE